MPPDHCAVASGERETQRGVGQAAAPSSRPKSPSTVADEAVTPLTLTTQVLLTDKFDRINRIDDFVKSRLWSAAQF
jgi:hypothetical protein